MLLFPQQFGWAVVEQHYWETALRDSLWHLLGSLYAARAAKSCHKDWLSRQLINFFFCHWGILQWAVGVEEQWEEKDYCCITARMHRSPPANLSCWSLLWLMQFRAAQRNCRELLKTCWVPTLSAKVRKLQKLVPRAIPLAFFFFFSWAVLGTGWPVLCFISQDWNLRGRLLP